MHSSQLPEDTIDSYPLIQQFFPRMHPRLQQEVETPYTGDKDITTVIALAERLHSTHQSTGAYGKERHDKQSKKSTYKKPEHKPNKKFNNNDNPPKTGSKERKEPGLPVVLKDIWQGIAQARRTKEM